MDAKLSAIRVGDQVYLKEGAEECGAVREVAPGGRDEITVYVENGGDFTIAFDAIRSAHDGKVVLDRGRIDQKLLNAVKHAHDREEPGL
ncbi:MAG TPA: hypothetical protein VGH50_04625 [Candidatus Binatia bacterium]|jgi:hypothetical protein